MDGFANETNPRRGVLSIAAIKKRAEGYWNSLTGNIDYLPLTGGVLTGELALNYSGARTIYQSGTDVLAIGLWDGVNARIESVGRPLYLTSYGSSIKMGISGGNTLTISGSSVGIGTTAPENLLHLHGNAVAGFTNSVTGDSNSDGLFIGNATVSSKDFDVWNYEASDLRFGTNNTEQLRIKPSGNIGIGTSVQSEKLSVNGNIKAKKIIVSQTGWPDYVFHTSYVLRPLKEVEQFIQKNKHLPDLPSAEEVEQNGISVGDNQALLLKKIEELTLYIILQGKEIEMLKQKILKQ